MGNKERTNKFTKVASVKAVEKTSASTKKLENTQHVNNFSECDTSKENFSNKRGEKAEQSGIGIEKSFAEQGSTRNTKRASKESSKEITLHSTKDSSGWQPVQEKRKSEKERHIKVYENKIFTQNMNKEGFKYSERRTVQSISQQPILHKTSDRKPAFRIQSKYINSNRIENKMDSGDKSSKSCSSNVSESFHQNYEKFSEKPVREKLDVNTVKLNSTDSKEKEPESFNLCTELPTKHSLETDTNCLLKNEGAIGKTSRGTQTSKQAHDATFCFVTNMKEQNKHESKESELKEEENNFLLSDITSKKEIVSDKNCCKTLRDKSICQTHFHEFMQERRENTNQRHKIRETTGCLKRQINNEEKTNSENEEKVNDNIASVADEYQNGSKMYENIACSSQFKDVVNNLEAELQYSSYNNGSHMLCRPVIIFPMHPCIPNSTSGHFAGYSNSGIPYQHFYDREFFNQNLQTEFPNVMTSYQEQRNKLSVDDKQSLENARNGFLNSNDFIYPPENLNHAYCMPFVMSWYQNGTVYYQYYPNYSPLECPCFGPRIQ